MRARTSAGSGMAPTRSPADGYVAYRADIAGERVYLSVPEIQRHGQEKITVQFVGDSFDLRAVGGDRRADKRPVGDDGGRLGPDGLQGAEALRQGGGAGFHVHGVARPNKSVRDFDIVTLDRLRRIDIEEDFASFREYASRAGIHGSIMAYLGIRNNHFYSIRTEVEGRHFVTARGWEDLSRTIQVHEKRNLPVNEGLAVQFLQDPEISRSFAVYYDLYKKYRDIYRVPDILAGRFTGPEEGEKLELDPVRIREMKVAPFDEKLSLISLLIDALSQAFAACARDKAVQELLMREMSQVRQVLKSAENKSVENQSAENKSAENKSAENKSAENMSVENQSAENTGEGDSASSQKSAETKLPGSSGRQAVKEEQPGRAAQNIAAEAIHERSGSLLRELRRKKEAGIPVEREQERVLRTACREMDGLREQLLEKSISRPLPPRMQYALIRDWFSAREQARQTAVKEADTSLTNAFRFLSHVYGDGQEMVLFLTELSSGYYSLKFINEHGNEEYFRYNRMLLLRERRDALRDEVLRLME